MISLPASSLTTQPMSFKLPANIFGPGLPPIDVPLTLPPMSVNVPAQNIPIPSQDVKLMDRDNLMGSLNVAFRYTREGCGV